MPSLDIVIIFFLVLSIILNIGFIKRIKRDKGASNIIFGMIISIVGISSFLFVWNFTFYSITEVIVAYFITIYLIVTGIFFTSIGFLFKEKDK